MSVYLDYNASTPINEEVLEAMISVYKRSYGNADSRTHDYGITAHRLVEISREKVSALLNVKKDEVFFTSGATESDNIAIQGIVDYAEEKKKKHIVTSAIEHKAVLEPLKHLSKRGFDITYVNPDESGRINYEDVIKSIRDDTVMVTIMHANNETGVIQPFKELGEYLYNTEILFHIDAAQTFGKLVNDLKKIKYDIASISAHKMCGPQGVGALILKKKHYKNPPIKPILFGGSQERGMRPGTIPTALIVGFGKMCEITKPNLENYIKTKKDILKLINESGVRYSINGDQDYCMPNTINICFDGVNSEAAMLYGKRYCALSNGSACNSNSYKPSHVLTAMGLDIDRVRSSIRMSWGSDTVGIIENLRSFLEIIKKLQ